MEIKLRHWNFIIIISGCLVINFSIKRAAGEADDNASAAGAGPPRGDADAPQSFVRAKLLRNGADRFLVVLKQ
jgi:hypothetical protein